MHACIQEEKKVYRGTAIAMQPPHLFDQINVPAASSILTFALHIGQLS